METIKEIAKTLRCTEKMASVFADRVRQLVGQEVPDKIILKSLTRLNPRSIEINKVVTEVRRELTRDQNRQRRHRTSTTIINPSTVMPTLSIETVSKDEKSRGRPTLIQKIESVLAGNWNRAEREGFRPQRLAVVDFVHAVHRHCDPRDATKPRLLRACESADKQEVIITPTLIADIIRQRS